MHLNTPYILRYLRVCLIALPVLFTSCKSEPIPVAREEGEIDLAEVRFSKFIYKNLFYEVVSKDSVEDDRLSTVTINKPLPPEWRDHRVPPGVIEKELLLKFTVFNTSDSLQQVYFYAGAYYTNFELYRLSQENKVEVIPTAETPPQYRASFRLIKLNPDEQGTYIARLGFVRTSATLFNPSILQKDYLRAFLAEKKEHRANINLITYVVSGIMLMMIFYSVAVYRRNGSSEFLLYTCYASCLALLLFLKSYLSYNFTSFNFLFESYWDFLIQCFGVGCYFIFIRRFLDTREKHPFLDRTFRIGQWVILGFLSIYTIIYFSSEHFILLNLFENITKQLLLVIGLIFIIYGARRKEDRLLRFLVLGNICLLVFSVISFLFIVFPIQLVKDTQYEFLKVFNSAIFYYEVGLVLELFYFLSGLAYKNRRDIIERTKERERLRTENEKKELEKQMAILEAQQEERNRISADMHDELGSGVTAIRLMSEIVKTKMKDDTLPEIDKISNSANDLITKMNTIIWTMTSSNDTVENLITYIRTYAIEFFESTNIQCLFSLPSPIPHIQLSGEKRRNIFLAVKESLNNIVKHSKCSRVTIKVEVDDKLTISIQDDGVGVDFESIRRFGNGLKNMRSRLERINGHFSIMNNGGALTRFEMSL